MKGLIMFGRKAGMIELREVPRPSIKEDEVLIQVQAAGICGTDIDFYLGKNAYLLNPPVILGHEFSGRIVEIGSKIKYWQEGERVVSDNTGGICGHCRYCLTGRYTLCESRKGIGYGIDGAFAEYVKIGGDVLKQFPGCLIKLPEGISFEEAAIMEPACNSYKAVVQEARVQPGEKVAIFGPGPIGLFCLQIAKIAGAARIIVTGIKGDEQRLKLAKELGATRVVNGNEQNPVEEILSANNGERVDVVIDAAGPPAVMKQAVEIVRREGRIIKIAWSSQSLDMSLDPLVVGALTLRGHWGYDYLSWLSVLNLTREKRIDYESMISEVLPLSKWEQAFQKIKERRAVKIVLNPGED